MGPGRRHQRRRQHRGYARLPENPKRHEPELLIESEGVPSGVKW